VNGGTARTRLSERLGIPPPIHFTFHQWQIIFDHDFSLSLLVHHPGADSGARKTIAKPGHPQD
jgi:hypothetical protein